MVSGLIVRFVENVSRPVPEKGLTPLAMKKLPAGSIQPTSWLKRQMEIALGGLPGQLWRTSSFLHEENGWLHPEKIFNGAWAPHRPWEEQTYYLRTLVSLAIFTKDPTALSVVERYMKIMLESQEEDGWFGPQYLKYFRADPPDTTESVHDIWAHMVMIEGILNWYEYTKEPAYLEMVRKFYHFCLNAADDKFIPAWYSLSAKFQWLCFIQRDRACDMLPALYKVIELTGDEALLPLVHRVYNKWPGPPSEFMSSHTVNFAQEFAYPTYYSRLAHKQWLQESAHFWYDQHMSVWGTLPRGTFCADERIRRGCTDPRYGSESCTFGEFARSFMYLGEMNMETVWADRAEDILFNYYPAAHTKDMKRVHYITASNHVMLDDYLSHNIYNKAHMFAYTDTQDRCCLHNAGLAWMVFGSYLLTKVHDGGICAWLHAGYEAETVAGEENTPVKVISETNYPFRDTVTFTLKLEKSAAFPFYLRIPRWCSKPGFTLNGEKLTLSEAGQGKFIVLEKTWQDGDKVEVTFPSEITLSENIRNGAITVNKGAFSYSLQIPEIENLVVSSKDPGNPAKAQWNEENAAEGNTWLELLPGSAWNYGLLPEEGFTFEERPLSGEFPFFWETAPMIIKAKGRKIPNWKLQDHMCAALQRSPVRSSEETEELTLIPMGCARLRLSVFPVISSDDWANEWVEVPEFTDDDARPECRN